MQGFVVVPFFFLFSYCMLVMQWMPLYMLLSLKMHKCWLYHKCEHKECFCCPSEAKPLNQILKFQINFGEKFTKLYWKWWNSNSVFANFKDDFESWGKYISVIRSQSIFTLTQLQILLCSHNPCGNKLACLNYWKQITSPGVNPVTRFYLLVS